MGADRRDAALRRMNLSVSSTGASVSPYVGRTVEVIVKPVFRFTHAILVDGDLSLGSSNNWIVDSFDSKDSSKSDPGTLAGGVYPSSASKQQSNGSIATTKKLPEGTYGALIEGNGAEVRGDVQTAGGDNPNTPLVHENVSGSTGMDQSRIKDDLEQEITTVAMPDTTGRPNSLIFNNFPSFLSSKSTYVIDGNLSAFAIQPPLLSALAPNAKAHVEILIKGNLNIGNGNSATITIPPNVIATIYVSGNIDFGNGEVNSNSSSSRVAGNLKIYGTGNSGTYTASGNPTVIAAIYAPTYDVTLSGNATSIGSVVGKSFQINGGGNGGFHYDESLGKGGDVGSWKVAGYFEDARADLQ
ncbi:MAG: hypothetical protein V4710_04200 [Verrucomicrobiota bacterium]